MRIAIHSMTPLSDSDIKRLKTILKESDCVNESLRATFGARYDHMDEQNIFFDRHSRDFTAYIDAEMKQDAG